MFTRSSSAFALMACLAVSSTLVAPASPVAAQGRVAGDVAGTWVGTFVQTEWTFEFKREGGAWSGRYMSARTRKWLPMQSLAVSGRTVRFSMDAKPPVAFSLEVDKSNKTLAGQVNVFGRNLPFSAARRS